MKWFKDWLVHSRECEKLRIKNASDKEHEIAIAMVVSGVAFASLVIGLLVYGLFVAPQSVEIVCTIGEWQELPEGLGYFPHIDKDTGRLVEFQMLPDSTSCRVTATGNMMNFAEWGR